MQPIQLARVLAVVNTAAGGLTVALAQGAYDLPTRRGRLAVQVAAGLGGGLVLLASDAVWNRATGDATVADPTVVLPAHETAVTLRQVGLSVAAAPLWWIGRGLPGRLRRNGTARPNRVLAVPLGLGWVVASAPTWWAHARDRSVALED